MLTHSDEIKLTCDSFLVLNNHMLPLTVVLDIQCRERIFSFIIRWRRSFCSI